MEPVSRVPPGESSRPEVSGNVVLFGSASFLTGVIAAQSQQRAEKVGASPKISNVTKKRHGHNFDFFGLKRIARLLNYVEQPCYSFQS